MIDLKPACHTMSDLLEGISGFQLCFPTPCTECTVRNLVEHIAETAWGATELAGGVASRSATDPAGDGPTDVAAAGPRGTTNGAGDRAGAAARGAVRPVENDLACLPSADYLRAVAAQVRALGMAWDNPAAWVGTTVAGGLELPNELWGKIAFTEMVVHGWDLAAALGRPFRLPEPTLRACLDHVTAFVPAAPVPALWGVAVDLPTDAPLIDRIVAVTGRNPHWVPAAVA
ncbi:TIGR03086 family metal-binding protein [Nocardia wallacei]|uniref:TIGR03086 family metal-binding protein n=1 Tax=Nocardia wallacei TaxID=480035 RepID=UPI0024539B74|nr:TIGR03086 family metal-binding protein [Nocardia wallacei]